MFFHNYIMKRGKKGLEIVWNFWIIMILSVIVLTFVLFFFSKNSENFLSEIKNYFSKTNIDSVIRSCNILASSGDKYSFCCDKKSVKYLVGREIRKGEFSCYELKNKNFSNNEISDLDCGNYSCG